MDLASIKFFETSQLVLETVIFNGNVLILVEKVVDFEFQLRKRDIFSTELVLKFDQFILKFDSQFAFVVKIMFQLVFILFELFPFILEHEL